MKEWDRMCEISWFYMFQLWAISWWEELNWDNKNHIFEVRGVSHWMKSLFGFTTWCCLDMLLAKLIILPATSRKFKQGKTPKTPMWIMFNKALLQPSAHFNHHKLLKSLSSISPSIRQPHSTQGWPQNKKQLLKPLLVLMAGGDPLASSGDADGEYTDRPTAAPWARGCFSLKQMFLFIYLCLLFEVKKTPKTVLLRAKSPLQQKFFHLHKNPPHCKLNINPTFTRSPQQQQHRAT